jgi:predicted DNA-binding protein (MmcQ/YjbR family)
MSSKSTVNRLRAVCLALPEAEEKVFGGHTTPTFRVCDKIFAMLEGDRGDSFWCKAPQGAQAVLVGSDPDRFYAPPYVGPKGWIGMRLHGAVDWDLVADLVRDGYRMTAPKRLAAALDGDQEGSSPTTRSKRGRPASLR